MAILTDTNTPARLAAKGAQGVYKEHLPISYDKDAEEGRKGYPAAKYPHYLPTWDPAQKFPPLEPFEHHDPGLDADPSYSELLPPGVQVTHLTPTIGTEIRGIQLSQLSAAGKDQLARYVAERKVVAFRAQDFASLPIDKAVDFARYFGPLHIHPTSGSPEGFPEVHLVHRAAGDRSAQAYLQTRTTSVAWHSDVSYEAQPPGTTFLYILEKPEAGGDTLFSDTVQAYRRLSPAIQERLHGLEVVHSGVEQANTSLSRGGILRRDPVVSTHPIVRTHPVTGEKALFVNPQSGREVVGLKQEESSMLLKFLYDHIASGADFQVRVRWEENSVVVWDNRVTQHTALIDWSDGQRRHIARLAPLAEKPYETPFAEI
ncbi:hypothetical protein CBS63078_6710 [Aspergillus niger]|uniref:Contig An03c0030, genomic contig n=5 Tax=Aspergillus TaxID=5052 RepID=A2QFT1_ASPNC|nr:uncharacterized protein An03g00660 [Aspergillus niger]XP_025453259.1 TauD-domain-containing protein [Aspergillus niger CBS 101883]EHA20956.1 hypothetical protein ASPNIDRAFT_57437 [Aspergillus niger ATCC 1015]RDH19622.1 TauD-domain-containing protein [Aspergillus niger ATCC 13496]RDK38677.1 TauD-domain-containing protein [Aspergillus phoenicis ATCC 13157]KAI2823387.1 hypothetical protein CBS115989_1369 [Aspergillus niger]KAI2830350.1 hypothetical protein CBS133816_3653 [Aspergillus niger]|eukprot:XP_001389970.1 alpha-ketoglutarate-dependent taurine dioxygenase [Aspergillus niger CBS 513.88]